MARILFRNHVPLEDVYGDLRFSSQEHQHLNALLLMRSLGVSPCAGRICKTNCQTHKINACGLGIYNFLKQVDSVVLATYDVGSIRNRTKVKFCRVSRSGPLPILKASDAMTCEHVFGLRCWEPDVY